MMMLPWFKAFHIIAMVAWFAGMFYIFRLYVYHVKFSHEKVLAEAYQIMEKKLLKYICYPAMMVTTAFGLRLIWENPSVLTAKWFHIKLGAVLLLFVYQIFAGHVYKRFKKGDIFLSEGMCRAINEIPTLMLVVIVIMVVVKPAL